MSFGAHSEVCVFVAAYTQVGGTQLSSLSCCAGCERYKIYLQMSCATAVFSQINVVPFAKSAVRIGTSKHSKWRPDERLIIVI